MKLSRRMQAALCVAATAFALAVPAGDAAAAGPPGVTPATVFLDLDRGGSATTPKTVTTPEILPKPDVVFVIDTTASMQNAIDNAAKDSNTILGQIAEKQPEAEFAVVEYRDLAADSTTVDDGVPFRVVQNRTRDQAAIGAALGELEAKGGVDAPEDGTNALFQVATGAVSFRPDSSRIVIWIGDNPSHRESGGHTVPQVIAALRAAAIKVIAVSVGNLAGLNGSAPLDGDAGQAMDITTATNGTLFDKVAPATVSDAILAGLRNLMVTVTPVLGACHPDLTVTLAPTSQTVTSGEDARFDETVTVSPNAVPGLTLTCSVEYLLDGRSAGLTTSIVEQVPKAVAAVGTAPSGSVPAGGIVSDMATVAGFAPTGTVAFELFPPSDAGCETPVATRTVLLASSAVSSGDIPAGGAGTYNWVVTYSGDDHNRAAVSACGSGRVVVVKATPTMATVPAGRAPAGGAINDRATVSPGFVPTGTVTFQAFAPTDTTCQAPPVATRVGTLSGGTASSGSIRAPVAGTYRWIATYDGDGNNKTVLSPCGSEQVIIVPHLPG
jgi:von Willebrand factor type A domain